MMTQSHEARRRIGLESSDIVFDPAPMVDSLNGPNQALEPTTMSVTDRAAARSAPATVVAHL